jgi:integrase/recombinase XerD
MPAKRHEKRVIAYLSRAEIEALIQAPDLLTWHGRRDRALLALALQTGLRVSELINLSCSDIVLGTGAHVRCMGKGRKERSTPIRKDSVKLLRNWLAERAGTDTNPVFISNRNARLSRDAVEQIVRKYVLTASGKCPSLKKKRVTPHVLRHSAAMQLLQNGVDRTVIALWLGHESVETTQMYIHADLQMKEKAMARTRPVKPPPGRYRPDDKLLAFLEAL